MNINKQQIREGFDMESFKFNVGDKVNTELFGVRSSSVDFTITDRKYGNADSGKVYKINSNAPYDQWISENWFRPANRSLF